MTISSYLNKNFQLYEYGIIEGYTIKCRRNKITNKIEVRYDEADKTWDKKDHYADLDKKHKNKNFILKPEWNKIITHLKLYDSTGKRIKEGQICTCSPGQIINWPYKIEIYKEINDNIITILKNNKEINIQYYLYSMLKDGKGEKHILWPDFTKERLTIIK